MKAPAHSALGHCSFLPFKFSSLFDLLFTNVCVVELILTPVNHFVVLKYLVCSRSYLFVCVNLTTDVRYLCTD